MFPFITSRLNSIAIRHKIFVLVLFVFYIPDGYGQTTHIYNGKIDKNTTWNGSLVLIHEDIEIKEGVILTIEKGVKLVFDKEKKMLVTGVLRAMGTAAKPIIFTTKSEDGWKGISLKQVKNTDTTKLIYSIIEFAENDKKDEGGAITLSKESKLYVYGCLFHENLGEKGGVIYGKDFESLKIVNTEFNNNRATDNGGALYFDGSKNLISLNNVSFISNSSKNQGGAIYLKNKELKIKLNNCTFNKNTSKNGSGIYILGINEFTSMQNVFLNNSSTEKGGAIFADDVNYFLSTNNQYTNNLSKSDGGALYLIRIKIAKLVGCVITNNYASNGGGGGLAVYNSPDIKITNSTIANNGAFIFLNEGILLGNSYAKILNTIIWNNSYQGLSLLTTKYSIINDWLLGGINIINSNPLFISPSSKKGISLDAIDADWRVQVNSPAVNSGQLDTSDLNLPTYDIYGTQRVLDNRIDRGAYETKIKSSHPLIAYPKPKICEGQKLLLVSTLKGTSYIWKKNNSIVFSGSDTLVLNNAIAGNSGNYICEISLGGEITVSDSLEITVFNNPELSLPDITICPGDTILYGPILIAGSTYLWSNGETSNKIKIHEANTLSLTVTNKSYCSTSDTLKVLLHPVSKLNLPSDISICNSESSVTINATTVNVANFLWRNNGEGTFEVSRDSMTLKYDFSEKELQENQPITIYLEGNSKFCGSILDSVKVSLIIKPQVQFNFNNICDGELVYFTLPTTQNIDSSTIKWDFGDGSTSEVKGPSHLYKKHGNYTVKLTICNNNGCCASNEKVVIVGFKPIAKFTADNYCIDEEIHFTSYDENPYNNSTFWWNFNDNSQAKGANVSHTFLSLGDYSIKLKVTTPEGCSDSIVQPVKISNKPELNFAVDYSCEEITFNYKGNTSSYSQLKWVLSNGLTSNQQKFTIPNQAVEKMTLEMENGKCVVSEIRNLTPYLVPIVNFETEYDTYMVNQPVVFNNKTQWASNFKWDFGDTEASTEYTPKHSYSFIGIKTIVLEAISKDNCLRDFTKQIEITSGMIAPDAFSPNGDMQNDSYHILGGPFNNFELHIFNQWGKMVFSSRNQQMGWDGTYNGKQQPAGVYVFLVRGKDLNNKAFEQTGNLILLR